ncbi:hypothetical protein FQA39_LY11439 [Lamprigera yunnana]|nr:hypothetical protein FQA39_LY11439 [Lamprigera yunnana]
MAPGRLHEDDIQIFYLRDILVKGGSAVDAMIATMFCEGVTIPHCMGIGGGFIMNIYDHATKTAEVLNAREAAPAGASIDMYENNEDGYFSGGLSVAIPGEVKGYWEAHQKHGKLPWRELVEPSIKFARCGYTVTPYLEKVLLEEEKMLQDNPGLRDVYINPKTKRPYKQDQIIVSKKLADTLEIIARDGEQALYNGCLTEGFVEDIQSLGGIITVEDINNYTPIWSDPLSTRLSNKYTVYGIPPPGSGAIFILILNILDGFLDLRNINTVQNWHKIVESFKLAYGRRTELGDPNFDPCVNNLVTKFTSKEYAEHLRKKICPQKAFNDPSYYGGKLFNAKDSGTCNMVVLAPNGDAVAATSTINTNFGAGATSESTGIILNNAMNDFSILSKANFYNLPPAERNFLKPGKRPMSSMSPSIIANELGDVVLAIGGSGGSKITTECALVTERNIFFNESIQKAISSKRLLHQLLPMHITAETGFCEDIIEGLKLLEHEIEYIEPVGFESVTAIAKQGNIVSGSFDPRRGGQVSLI